MEDVIIIDKVDKNPVIIIEDETQDELDQELKRLRKKLIDDINGKRHPIVISDSDSESDCISDSSVSVSSSSDDGDKGYKSNNDDDTSDDENSFNKKRKKSNYRIIKESKRIKINTNDEPTTSNNLKWIIIDGSNVAMSHGNNKYFSCEGIEIAVKYFENRGHDHITVYVPEGIKKRSENFVKKKEILSKLKKKKLLVYTPSNKINGRSFSCYDDMFMLTLAARSKGIIVSNDKFRDLLHKNSEWKKVINTSILPFVFTRDIFIPANDPHGKNGLELDEFLSH